jgi:hypothetical protein
MAKSWSDERPGADTRHHIEDGQRGLAGDRFPALEKADPESTLGPATRDDQDVPVKRSSRCLAKAPGREDAKTEFLGGQFNSIRRLWLGYSPEHPPARAARATGHRRSAC